MTDRWLAGRLDCCWPLQGLSSSTSRSTALPAWHATAGQLGDDFVLDRRCDPTVPLQVDLGEVYQGADRGLHRCRLRSMVCYYGQHYQALVLVPEAGGWLMFDDTRVTVVGSWADVRHKCEAGRIQPSVLFYEQA